MTAGVWRGATSKGPRRTAQRRGPRRVRLRMRWQDEAAYLFSNPANATWIVDSLAELDRWRLNRERADADRRRIDARVA